MLIKYLDCWKSKQNYCIKKYNSIKTSRDKISKSYRSNNNQKQYIHNRAKYRKNCFKEYNKNKFQKRDLDIQVEQKILQKFCTNIYIAI